MNRVGCKYTQKIMPEITLSKFTIFLNLNTTGILQFDDNIKISKYLCVEKRQQFCGKP